MKTPRNVSGLELIKLLKPYGYEIVRQTGSHIRIRTVNNGEHFETVPRHNPIKVGTLNDILSSIAGHFSLEKEELMHDLFG